MRFATNKKRMVAAALAAALTLALAGCAAKPETVDPAPFLTVEFTGMSGEGTAEWNFDSEGFAAACGEGVKDAAGLAACVDGSLDKTEGLSTATRSPSSGTATPTRRSKSTTPSSLPATQPSRWRAWTSG